jgi:hypothetical protein
MELYEQKPNSAFFLLIKKKYDYIPHHVGKQPNLYKEEYSIERMTGKIDLTNSTVIGEVDKNIIIRTTKIII